jgi:hypothetical protein
MFLIAHTKPRKAISDAGNTLRDNVLSLIRWAAREGWEVLVKVCWRWQTNMDPVYMVVKARSTRYCAVNLGQAQDIDNLHVMTRSSSA